MDRTIEAEYIAEERVLKLAEPLAGVRNHETVRVTIDDRRTTTERGDWPTLSEEAGRELVAQAAGALLLEDERRFIDLPKSPLWWGEEKPIVG